VPAVLAVPSALGQAPYPSQTVKLMVPNPAGGLPDTVARIVGKRLQERLAQSVVIENRPGANGRVAVAACSARRPTDIPCSSPTARS
jgi:tripartite-type tricarboxylate transporter receptor subunit TctC